MNLWATITPTWQVIDQLNSFSRHSVEEFAWNSSDWPSPLGLTMYFKVISRISSCWMLRKMWSVNYTGQYIRALIQNGKRTRSVRTQPCYGPRGGGGGASTFQLDHHMTDILYGRILIWDGLRVPPIAVTNGSSIPGGNRKRGSANTRE
ncbi:predicted protein [Histoplasma capsulatum G186AR]|uniref:Uncharacterized protein n=1 Tax=Ajellomyces capsulatus (strain G186AR / H82 / ATCC MYA-2454 / RMSCC 2432) TaxID=447093 RepID=C0NTL1_AJECG|nr:uncharacterized protein HCBG_06491 [Histoplasma capsulatum G186AR]EEH05372.1 predicted protein [Histoplasma capsulatum G186AR]